MVVEKDVEAIEAVTEHHEGPSYKRPRTIKKSFKKIVRPNGSKTRMPERIRAFINQEKTYQRDDGREVSPGTKAKLVDAQMDSLNRMAHRECAKMNEELQKANGGKPMYWKDIPKNYIQDFADNIEQAAVKQHVYFDKCLDQWAAKGLLATQYQNNFNPGVKVL